MLELDLGILFCGVVCQLVGMWLTQHKVMYTAALWLGILLALAASWHMYRTIDRAMDLGESAAKVLIAGNLLRYAVLVIVLGIIMVTNILNPLVVFLGCMMLKVAAYLQPFTHKLCNQFFHETDPVPEPMPEEAPESSEQDPQE